MYRDEITMHLINWQVHVIVVLLQNFLLYIIQQLLLFVGVYVHNLDHINIVHRLKIKGGEIYTPKYEIRTPLQFLNIIFFLTIFHFRKYPINLICLFLSLHSKMHVLSFAELFNHISVSFSFLYILPISLCRPQLN